MRPDWIIETGTGDGGRALFLASICELLDHGQVVSIGGGLAEDLPLHPRITYIDGELDGDARSTRVRGIVGRLAALVVLGGRGHGGSDTALLRGVRPAGRRGLVPDRHRHHRQRQPGVDRLRSRSLRGGQAVCSSATASSSPTPSSSASASRSIPEGFLKRTR